jgi:hypothetical protein
MVAVAGGEGNGAVVAIAVASVTGVGTGALVVGPQPEDATRMIVANRIRAFARRSFTISSL